MNIYRGMDIGTAKPSPEERARVKTFGVDLADPTETFSVGDWLRAVRPAFDITQTPIVVGGTGLYVKCLLQGLDDLPTADTALRERTEKMTLAELQTEARAAAPEAYEALADKENPRRLVRLLEGKKISESWKTELPVVIGLNVERAELHRRIAARVGKMYAGGLLEEARRLAGLKLSSTAQHAIGYAEAFAVLRGEMTAAEAKEKTIIRTRQLSKRQMTWFRHQLNVQWIETAECPDTKSLADKIAGAWEKVGAVPMKGV
jgi:tRNA dimethylallyltransferase